MCFVLNLPLALLKHSMKEYFRFCIWFSGLSIIRRPVSYSLAFKYVYWRASQKGGIYVPGLAVAFVSWNTWSQEHCTSNRTIIWLLVWPHRMIFIHSHSLYNSRIYLHDISNYLMHIHRATVALDSANFVWTLLRIRLFRQQFMIQI